MFLKLKPLLLAGTDHAVPHLYDVNTYQCFLPSTFPDSGVNGAINQVLNMFSSKALYVLISLVDDHGFMTVRFLVSSGAVFFNWIRLRYSFKGWIYSTL